MNLMNRLRLYLFEKKVYKLREKMYKYDITDFLYKINFFDKLIEVLKRKYL